MTTFRNILFFLVCFAVGAGAVWLVRHIKTAGNTPPPAVTTGTGLPPKLHGFELPAAGASSAITAFAPFNATAVAIEYGDGSQLAPAVKAAHDAHLSALLLPGTGSGPAFSLQDPYPKPLADIAAEAQAAGADALCISWVNDEPDENFWRPQIAAIRKAFSGKLLFAANDDAAPAVGLWDAVDYMAIAGPVQLPRRLPGAATDYTVDDARHLWAAKLDEWESLAAKSDRSLVLLNIDLPADTGATLPTGASPPPPPAGARNTFYQALLTETRGRRHTDGLFLRWDPATFSPLQSPFNTLWSPTPDPAPAPAPAP